MFVKISRHLVHPARSATGAVLALLAAKLMGFPEFWWAPVSTMVVMQSNLGSALTVSWQRWVGTALGSAGGALLASWFGANVIAYAAGVFGMGLVCAALRLDRAAYRFAAIALTIVMLVTHAESVWVVALHRFLEVSLGIAMGLLMTVLWPDRENSPGFQRK